METNKYEQQANEFLKKTGAEIKIEYHYHGKHFIDDVKMRDVYKITILRGKRSYTFNFGQSIAKSGLKLQMGRKEILIEVPDANKHLSLRKNETALRYYIKNHIDFDILPSDKITYPEQPTNYDILACLQKYDAGSFEDFCSDYGYDEDSRKAEKTYNAVREEYTNLCTIFSDEEMELMREIQ